ncbi:hypothetical protein ACFSHT_35700 [Paraburkholderia silviterrae]|uniref:Uncharacterized protein n=1 Tax=Paraburkholderia silviterrae TaxID=2528715 RepID=A0A4R5M7B1_9BURK|nr:hypothetical protein [Paraburkholderia silviterrae]TDG22004.1 hypothetical protein EYW47_19125 [Paraburkholderia silviterrae]
MVYPSSVDKFTKLLQSNTKAAHEDDLAAYRRTMTLMSTILELSETLDLTRRASCHAHGRNKSERDRVQPLAPNFKIARGGSTRLARQSNVRIGEPDTSALPPNSRCVRCTVANG